MSGSKMDWFIEGLADFVAQEYNSGKESKIYKTFIEGKTDLKKIGNEKSYTENYPRGQLFFIYFVNYFGGRKLKDLLRESVIEAQGFEKVIQDITYYDFDTLKEKELIWSTEYLKSFKKSAK